MNSLLITQEKRTRQLQEAAEPRLGVGQAGGVVAPA